MNTLTPEGGANCARDWRGLATAQPGPERVSAEPRKARFFAEQKMRPNRDGFHFPALFPRRWTCSFLFGILAA
jgi:hypothetical protein